MRTSAEILAEFDSPANSNHVATGIASPISTVRERAQLETLLDVRDELVEMKSQIAECKEELVEIKANTAA